MARLARLDLTVLMTQNAQNTQITLVIGGHGKTGRRVAEKLTAQGRQVRIGSRSGTPAFDWHEPATWVPALEGVDRVYVTYYPDLAFPGAAEQVAEFSKVAVAHGARRLVLLSGRGEEAAEISENNLKASGADWTIVRSSWFNQNFNESFFLEPVLAGEIALPTGDAVEAFVDADDIADVVVAALTDDKHIARPTNCPARACSATATSPPNCPRPPAATSSTSPSPTRNTAPSCARTASPRSSPTSSP